MPLPDPAFLVVAMMMVGTGTIFFWHDRAKPASRALSLCMIAIGIRLLPSGMELDAGDTILPLPVRVLIIALEGVAILSGMEWGRRIAQTGTYAPDPITLRLFKTGQILVVIFCLLRLGVDLTSPEVTRSNQDGFSRISALQWILFGPSLGLGILLTSVAIHRLRTVKIDDAELVRLQALSLAGPFLLSALFVKPDWVPVTLGAGLLVFLWGSVRYLILQGQRGHFMRQFLSPELAQMVQSEGMERTLQKDRRILTALACDLRGFTNYARTRSSHDVTTLLENFYQVVGEVTAAHGGTVKDHAGDGMLILVGAPLAQPEHERQAVQLALDIRNATTELLHESAPELGIGIGLATGHTTVGAIRGAGRLEYVAVGNPVNLASRLCDRAAPGEILSDRRTADALRPEDGIRIDDLAPEPLKGFPEPIPVCALGGEPKLGWRERRRQRRNHRRGR